MGLQMLKPSFLDQHFSEFLWLGLVIIAAITFSSCKLCPKCKTLVRRPATKCPQCTADI